MIRLLRRPDHWAVTALLLLAVPTINAGGGGVMPEDRCVVELGFMQTHLTIYQPATQGSEKFCDAVPDVANSIFVFDYLHTSLAEAPIEFRIIEDVTGLGRFATWEDVQAIEDLASVTVAHEPAKVGVTDFYKAEHRFEREGDYLIVVTAGHPSEDITYHAVAPLSVGDSPWLYWALGAAGVPALGAGAWLGLRRRQSRS